MVPTRARELALGRNPYSLLEKRHAHHLAGSEVPLCFHLQFHYRFCLFPVISVPSTRNNVEGKPSNTSQFFVGSAARSIFPPMPLSFAPHAHAPSNTTHFSFHPRDSLLLTNLHILIFRHNNRAPRCWPSGRRCWQPRHQRSFRSPGPRDPQHHG